MQFHPSFINQYICVYNDGHAAGLGKKGKPFKAVKPNHVKFWNSKAKAIRFAKRYPELGVYVITSLISKQLVED